MKYRNNTTTKSKSKLTILIIIVSVLILAGISGAFGARMWYQQQLQPVSKESRVEVVEIPVGASVQQIAVMLEEKSIIRNSQAFLWYVRNNRLVEDMKAGTYTLDASKTTPDIISTITDGKVDERLVTILPGQRMQQIRNSLIKAGFSESEVDLALDAGNYKNNPALIAKPSNQTLEGYLYPESFTATSSTTAKSIVLQSLEQMAQAMTPDYVDAWQQKGLGIHQAVTLASIVEKEVSNESDKELVAGVFLNRLKIGMPLGSDPTYLYAGYISNQDGNRNIDSPYNTYKITGLPPGPISNVTKSSLKAVAYPKESDYLYFVAGDDGITRFSKTLAEHEALTKQYCIDLCSSY